MEIRSEQIPMAEKQERALVALQPLFKRVREGKRDVEDQDSIEKRIQVIQDNVMSVIQNGVPDDVVVRAIEGTVEAVDQFENSDVAHLVHESSVGVVALSSPQLADFISKYEKYLRAITPSGEVAPMLASDQSSVFNPLLSVVTPYKLALSGEIDSKHAFFKVDEGKFLVDISSAEKNVRDHVVEDDLSVVLAMADLDDPLYRQVQSFALREIFMKDSSLEKVAEWVLGTPEVSLDVKKAVATMLEKESVASSSDFYIADLLYYSPETVEQKKIQKRLTRAADDITFNFVERYYLDNSADALSKNISSLEEDISITVSLTTVEGARDKIHSDIRAKVVEKISRVIQDERLSSYFSGDSPVILDTSRVKSAVALLLKERADFGLQKGVEDLSLTEYVKEHPRKLKNTADYVNTELARFIYFSSMGAVTDIVNGDREHADPLEWRAAKVSLEKKFSYWVKLALPHVTEPREILYYAGPARLYNAGTIPLFFKRLVEIPEGFEYALQIMSETNENTFLNRKNIADFFKPDIAGDVPALYARLFAPLEPPFDSRFVYAAQAAGALLEVPRTKKDTTKKIIELWDKTKEPWKDSSLLYTLRIIAQHARLEDLDGVFEYITTALPDECDTSHLEAFLPDKAQTILGLREKKFAKDRKREEKRRRDEAPKEILERLKTVGKEMESLLSERDVRAVLTTILTKRDSQIGDSGHTASIDAIAASPLTAILTDVTLKKDRQFARDEKTLACLAVFAMKPEGTLYTKLDPNGELIIRIMKDGTDIGAIRKANAEENGLSLKVFEEIHYLVARALEIVSVRQPKETAEQQDDTLGDIAGVGEEENKRDTSDDTLEQLRGKQEPVLPKINKRETDGTMHIDLTTGAKEQLEAIAKVEVREIDVNRERVFRLFGPMVRGEHPTDIPNEVEEVVVYKRERAVQPKRRIRKGSSPPSEDTATYYKIDSVDAYVGLLNGELSPDDIFVRTTRAFSTPLPYRKTEYNSGLPDGGEHAPLITVKRSEPTPLSGHKYDAFLLSGGAEIHREPLKGYVSYDVDRTPDFDTLYEKIRKGGSFLADFVRAKVGEVEDELKDRRHELGLKYLYGKNIDFDTYEKEVREAELAAKKKAVLIVEQWEGASERSVRDRDTIRFVEPGHEFNRTFNQGQFQSLRELVLSFETKKKQDEET